MGQIQLSSALVNIQSQFSSYAKYLTTHYPTMSENLILHLTESL